MTHKLEILGNLAGEIAKRRNGSPDQSYTARLLSQGMEKCAKKLGEEAVELALAAVLADRPHIIAEAADVLYHLLVVLEAADVPVPEVMAELDQRSAESGLAEKARRKRT